MQARLVALTAALLASPGFSGGADGGTSAKAQPVEQPACISTLVELTLDGGTTKCQYACWRTEWCKPNGDCRPSCTKRECCPNGCEADKLPQEGACGEPVRKVTATECSHWAESDLSRVTAVQPSFSTFTCWRSAGNARCESSARARPTRTAITSGCRSDGGVTTSRPCFLTTATPNQAGARAGIIRSAQRAPVSTPTMVSGTGTGSRSSSARERRRRH